MSNRPRLTIDLSSDILDRLKDVSEKADMSPSMIARAYIEKCLNDNLIPTMNVTFSYTKETKKKNKQVAENSIQKLKETGILVDSE